LTSLCSVYADLGFAGEPDLEKGIRTKTSRINNPVGYCYPTGEWKMVDAGGNAPLVGFRTVLRRRVYSPRSGSASF